MLDIYQSQGLAESLHCLKTLLMFETRGPWTLGCEVATLPAAVLRCAALRCAALPALGKEENWVRNHWEALEKNSIIK